MASEIESNSCETALSDRPKFWFTDEVARYLRRDQGTVRRSCREGLLPAKRCGQSYFILDEDLTAFLSSQ